MQNINIYFTFHIRRKDCDVELISRFPIEFATITSCHLDEFEIVGLTITGNIRCRGIAPKVKRILCILC